MEFITADIFELFMNITTFYKWNKLKIIYKSY